MRTRKRNELCAPGHDEKLAIKGSLFATPTTPLPKPCLGAVHRTVPWTSYWGIVDSAIQQKGLVTCVIWFFTATGMGFDLFPNAFKWFLHRGLFPVVQHKKRLFKTENSRIKISRYKEGFQQFCKLPKAVQAQSRHHCSAEAGNAYTGLSFDPPASFDNKRVDYCPTTFMDICELRWFVQLEQQERLPMHLPGGGQSTTVFSLKKNRFLPQSTTRNTALTIFQPWLDPSLKSHPWQYLVPDAFGDCISHGGKRQPALHTSYRWDFFKTESLKF